MRSRRQETSNAILCHVKIQRLVNEREAKAFIISTLTKQVLNSPNKSTMITDLVKNYAQEKKKESVIILYHTKIQKFMQNNTATWNDMKSQRSKIVFNAKYAQDTKDQAKHVVLVVVCFKASVGQESGRATNQQ